MTKVPATLFEICLIILMAVGIYAIITALRIAVNKIRLPNVPAKQSRIKLPFIKQTIEVEGPAWLILLVVGCVMTGSPVLAAYSQKSPGIQDSEPISVKSVQKVEADRETETNQKLDAGAFVFLSDSSILDLRQSQSVPWFTYFRVFADPDKRKRVKPAILHNIMRIRKVKDAQIIHLAYGTSATLDVSCLTQQATVVREEVMDGSTQSETMELAVDVGSIAVGETFEVVVEAIYWDAFSDPKHDDYTTYSNDQNESEDLSILLIAPNGESLHGLSITEYPGKDKPESFSGSARAHPESGGGATYYWTTTNRRPDYYYKLTWEL